MTTVLLLIAAAFLLGGKDLAKKAFDLWLRAPRFAFSIQQAVASLLLVAAFVSFSLSKKVDPSPPEPKPPASFTLKGRFTGQTAADDAMLVSAMTAELADEIAWDGTLQKPTLTTGVAIDELRRRLREMRCRGESIGERQPQARDAIARHLDIAVGNAGGPIDEAKRAAWVKALGEISEAAADVTR